MWTMIIPVALKLLEWFLDSRKADAETKKAFLDMVNMLGSKGLISVNLHSSYEDQRKKNQQELANLNPPS